MPLPNVTPGDVITAAYWNHLISLVNDLETRLADLEGQSSDGTLRITQVFPTGTVTAGDTIRISGRNFDFVRGAHSVFVGTTRATNFLNGSSDSLLIVQIPDLVTGATPSGASLNLTVGNLTSVVTWPMTIKSKPIEVGGGVEFGFLNSTPTVPAANSPIQYNFRLASLSNVNLPVLITPDLQFPGAPAGLVEVRDSDGQLKTDRTIALPAGAAKIIGVRITSIPNVANGTPFALAVTATAPGIAPVAASVPPQTVGQAAEQPDSTITNLTFNRVLDGSASFTAAPAGDTVDGIVSIPGNAAATVTIALDTTFANIPAGSTFNYVPSADVVSGAGWSSAPNALVTPPKYIVSSPGEQQFPGFDINAASGTAVIRFTLTREGVATNNKRSVTFRVTRT
jgi:hypothetical protein